MKQTMHVGDNKFLIIYIVTVLLFYTSGVCFAIVYQEIEELNTESGTDISSTQMEIVFFTVAGIACIPIGIWIHKNWKNDLTPYLIAISGSLVLILLYIVYNTIAPSIDGLHDDSGILDILSRILQVAIIIAGSYGLYSIITWRKKTLESLR